MSGRVIVLGLDGISFDLIGKWIDSNELPTFRKLRDEYPSGNLKSTILPLTCVSWTSIFTGRNPGKHGIIDFGELDREKYWYSHYNDSKDVKSEYVWDILEEKGIKCGVINIYFTSPFRSRISFGEGDSLRKDWVNFEWPEDTKAKVIPTNPGFEKRINHVVDIRFDQIEYVLEKKEFGFLAMNISVLDPLQHFRWHKEESILRVLKRIDSRLERLLKRLPEDVSLLLISDHGMITLEKWFHTNNWLQEKGYLRFRESPKAKESKAAKVGVNRGNFERLFNPVISLIDILGLRRFVPKSVMRTFKKLRGMSPSRGEIEFNKLIELIDWENTTAYSFGSEGRIFLNVKDREGQGIVTKKEFAAVREEIIDDLTKDFGDEIEIFRSEELYSREHLNKAPDIVFIIKEGRFRPSMNYRTDGSMLKEPVPEMDTTANHSMNGMLIAYGRDFRKAGVEASVYDIAPTVLHLLGAEIPDDMDGKVLTGIFKKNSEPGKRKPRYKKAGLKDMIKGIVDGLDLGI